MRSQWLWFFPGDCQLSTICQPVAGTTPDLDFRPFYHVITFTFQPLEEHFHFHVAGTTPDLDFRPFLIRIIFCRPFISSPQLRRWSQCLSRTTHLFVHNWIYLEKKAVSTCFPSQRAIIADSQKRNTWNIGFYIWRKEKCVPQY